ncbi:hypothetical protein Tsubulata_044133 [Turnera subulata]|uniref:Uncharacterized protein n=1 Tax=Turnera subulata TaxID=218843 RepID=A0A9Q0G9E6_9ROSI|nr:hypothetical protein Tsubulata_044133 [Turnera subulata]
MAKRIMSSRLLSLRPISSSSSTLNNNPTRHLLLPSTTVSPNLLTFKTLTAAATHDPTETKPKKKKKSSKKKAREAEAIKQQQVKEKRRTRSDKEYDDSHFPRLLEDNEDHVPVMLPEVLDVFASMSLRSFVDCTLGAAGHSSAVIKAHPELQCYVGMDVDPVAHAKAGPRLDDAISCANNPNLRAHLVLKNFRHLSSSIHDLHPGLSHSGVDAILMDLGMSSMQVNNPERGFSVIANGPLDMRMDPQASLTAQEILNSWPDSEVGRILRDYGEESNWYLLQNKIVQARLRGGLNSTSELRDLIENLTRRTRGGRQGWIKTATRVFQALRIAVNDELGTLEKSIHSCFTCLAPGGRLAIISFHSLEDRIVKQAFLNIIGRGDGDGEESSGYMEGSSKIRGDNGPKDAWIRQIVQGRNGTILTKRPVTPSEEEERLNRRSRSAKLRVIEKLR